MTTKPSLMTLCVVLLSVLIVSDTAFAQQKIDTLWVYDEATFSRMSLNQRIAYAQARIEEANDVMMNSNLSERFELPLVESLQEAPFDSDSGTCSVDVLNFLRDSQWIKARRSVADIVVLVVSEIGSCPFEGETSNDICGGTFNIPKVLGSHRSESHAFAFLTDDPECDDEVDITGAHELGHVIGAEHEFIAGLDNNADSILPSPFNHGYKGFAGTASTVMVSTTNQPVMALEFSSGQETWARNQEFISSPLPNKPETPWQLVANYRPAIPPDPPICFVSHFCTGPDSSNLIFSFFPATTGGGATDFEIRRAYGSGSWGPPIVNPEAGCTGFPGIEYILNRFLIRAFGPAGTSECIAVFLPNCDEVPPI